MFFAVLLAAAVPLGSYLAKVFNGERTFLTRLIAPLESGLYRLCSIDPADEMTWSAYARAMLALTLTCAAVLYLILRTQAWLPLNPQHFPNVSPLVAWNTAISFVTTTDWQVYAGESTMSYFSQMAGLAWTQFIAGAIGLAASAAFIRAFVRSRASTLGNFWVDLTRSLLYVLLPLCVVFTIAFVSEGIPQNFAPYRSVTNAEHFTQSITGGPMASFEAPKLVGGNGGGFVAANSASPNENPTAISNLLELLAFWLIPAALPLTFGRMIGKPRAGVALLAAIVVLGTLAFVVAQTAESAGNPLVHAMGVPGGNMEGKEVRFGADNAGLSLTVASDSGTGSSNFAYDSLMPIGGLVAMANMQLSEVVFGGIGSGLYGLLVFTVLTVFICGLMVGRTPEYLGKRIEGREVQFAMLAVLIFPVVILLPSAIASVTKAGLEVLGNTGPHGFSEIVYAFSSSAANNGSAFAGLGSNTLYDVMTGLSMFGGRILVLIPTLALAGAIASRPLNAEAGPGTFATDNTMFVALLIGVILIVGLLTFLPADALGAIAEQLSFASFR